MPVASLTMVTLDSADPTALAAFWADFLGGEIVYATDEVSVVRTDRGAIATCRVPDYTPPTWPAGERPKHVHLDLAVDDKAVAEAEALRLGARVADDQPGGDTWRVLLDPAGHPFCLTSVPMGWPPLEKSTEDQ
jgi:catechol 2,3-dioxygenase-like lactoylglutathione lyase family enzyme